MPLSVVMTHPKLSADTKARTEMVHGCALLDIVPSSIHNFQTAIIISRSIFRSTSYLGFIRNQSRITQVHNDAGDSATYTNNKGTSSPSTSWQWGWHHGTCACGFVAGSRCFDTAS